ncbi:MAG TPA: hypothetical protein VLC46_10895 [Thermoanaerobaculia bacterium]|nr:hypothetical protein [Thermoanaerobaculia bacterium]
MREKYWAFPPLLCWLLFPLLSGVIAAVIASSVDFPIPVWAGLPIAVWAGAAAGLAGLLLGGFLARRVPAWNRARSQRIAADGGIEFRTRFQALTKRFEGVAADVGHLQEAVNAKLYGSYVERAKVISRLRELAKADDLDLFFDSAPIAISELMESVQELILKVESDPKAVTAYEPDLFERIEYLGRRTAAGNVVDCYQAVQELEPLLEGLKRRNAPFNLGTAVKRLKNQVQQYRDQILSDPHRDAVWRDLQVQDEVKRHHDAMEREAKAQTEAAQALADAAEAHAEAARKQAASVEEQNEILRKQLAAQRANAAGTVANALYIRKLANLEQSKRDRETSDD